MPVHGNFVRFELAATQQALGGRFPAGKFAQPIGADRFALYFQKRKQGEIGDLLLGPIPARIKFGAPCAPCIRQQEFALMP